MQNSTQHRTLAFKILLKQAVNKSVGFWIEEVEVVHTIFLRTNLRLVMGKGKRMGRHCIILYHEKNYCCPLKFFIQNKSGLTLLTKYQPFWLPLFFGNINSSNYEQRYTFYRTAINWNTIRYCSYRQRKLSIFINKYIFKFHFL